MRDRNYFFDLNDLQYKQVSLPWRIRIRRLLFWALASVAVTFLYVSLFHHFFGSPKDKMLQQELSNMKLQYSILGRQMDQSVEALSRLRSSDDILYRPILDMDSIPESLRNPGFGGVDRFMDLYGYTNTGLMIQYRARTEEIKSRTNIQIESFRSVEERKNEWKREMEYLPYISPVNPIYRLGDGVKFRERHPVLGTPQWHHGQDFNTPYGTEVHATGSGKVIKAGWSSGGFGNFVVIDHGYGFQTTYGHLSSIKVSLDMNVKRGDLIGLSGSSGTSSGPHLHYQIDLYGRNRNPLHYFNNDLSEEEYFEMIQTLSSGLKLR